MGGFDLPSTEVAPCHPVGWACSRSTRRWSAWLQSSTPNGPVPASLRDHLREAVRRTPALRLAVAERRRARPLVRKASLRRTPTMKHRRGDHRGCQGKEKQFDNVCAAAAWCHPPQLVPACGLTGHRAGRQPVGMGPVVKQCDGEDLPGIRQLEVRPHEADQHEKVAIRQPWSMQWARHLCGPSTPARPRRGTVWSDSCLRIGKPPRARVLAGARGGSRVRNSAIWSCQNPSNDDWPRTSWTGTAGEDRSSVRSAPNAFNTDAGCIKFHGAALQFIRAPAVRLPGGEAQLKADFALENAFLRWGPVVLPGVRACGMTRCTPLRLSCEPISMHGAESCQQSTGLSVGGNAFS
jgi:hypothetical protein